MRFPAALWGRLGADLFGGSSHFGRGFDVFKKVGTKSRTFSNGRSRLRLDVMRGAGSFGRRDAATRRGFGTTSISIPNSPAPVQKLFAEY